MGLGITVNELKNTKENSIMSLSIAIKLIDYALIYNDDKLILKINSNIMKESLILYLKQKQ